jgi:hypothetical protein
LRSNNSANPHPLVVKKSVAYTTAKQFKDYLLGECCEELFRINGEDWVIPNSYRGPGQFAFRDALLRSKPFLEQDDSRVYAAASIPGLDMDKVIYFAASVFWRAAVHSWRRDERLVNIKLGPYEEEIRLFLLGQAHFPQRVALHVWVSGLQGDLLAVIHAPESGRIDNYHTHQFAIPGMVFAITIAAHISDAQRRWATSAPERFVAIVLGLDLRDVADMARRLQSVPRD